jgi:hydroxymethylbilane synthase
VSTRSANAAAPVDQATPAVRIGTRSSRLARTQTQTVVDALTAAGLRTEVVPMTSEGDRSRASLASLGGTGVFAAALRTALLTGECDAVVHSLKDLPTTPHPGLVVAATPPREDARDALCARDGLTLATLPAGARIGTGSPRRAAQLRTARPDLEVVDIRGNVDTRLGFVSDGRLDAVILAAAGLRRIGRADAITAELGLDTWPGAPGQGVLAVEIREADASGTPLAAALAGIHDVDAWAAATAERSLLATLEAGCAAPVGATATVSDGVLTVSGSAYRPGGGESRTAAASGRPDEAVALGRAVAADLIAAGAGAWITG